MTTKARRAAAATLTLAALSIAGCSAADVASRNLSTAADQCSLGNSDPTRVSVTCKVGPDAYKKHFLGLSDNVTFFAEQLEGSNVSTYHYKVVFKPSVIIPDVEVR